MRRVLLALVAAIALTPGVAFVVVSGQDYYRAGGSSGGGGGSVTPGPWTMTNGSKMDDTANGTVQLADSTGAGLTRLRFGSGAAMPEFLIAATTFRLGKVNAGSVGLGFEGAALPTACDGIFAMFSIVYSCNGFGEWRALGPTSVPTSPVGGAITPAALTGGNAVFVMTVSGTPTQLTFSLMTANSGWYCDATNITANAAHRANQRVVQLSGGANAVVMENQLVSTGAAAALTASDEVRVHCHQF